MWALTLQVRTRARDKLWRGQLQCWTGARIREGELEQVVKHTWKPPAQIHPHSYSASWSSSNNRPNICMTLRHKRQQAEHKLKQMSYLNLLLSVVSLP